MARLGKLFVQVKTLLKSCTVVGVVATVTAGLIATLLIGNIVQLGVAADLRNDSGADPNAKCKTEGPLTNKDVIYYKKADFKHSYLSSDENDNHFSDGRRFPLEYVVPKAAEVTPLSNENEKHEQTWKVVFNREGVYAANPEDPSAQPPTDTYTSKPHYSIFFSKDLKVVSNYKFKLGKHYGQSVTAETPPYDDRFKGIPPVVHHEQQNENIVLPSYRGPYPAYDKGTKYSRAETLDYAINHTDVEMKFTKLAQDLGKGEREPRRVEGLTDKILLNNLNVVQHWLYDTWRTGTEKQDLYLEVEFTTKRNPLANIDTGTDTFVGAHYKSHDKRAVFIRTDYTYVEPDNRDCDGDKLPDRYELAIGSNPANQHSDNDGVIDSKEINVVNEDGTFIRNEDGRIKAEGDFMENNLIKIDGTDPVVGKQEYVGPGISGYQGEVIRGKAAPNTTVALWVKNEHGQRTHAIAETIADKDGNYRLVVGKVLKRGVINKYGNDTVLNGTDGDDDVTLSNGEKITPKYEETTNLGHVGDDLELNVWSDGWDERPLFSKPTVSSKHFTIVNLDKKYHDSGYDDINLTPRHPVDNTSQLTEAEKQAVIDKLVAKYPALTDDLQADHPLAVNNDGSLDLYLKGKDDPKHVPGNKIVVQKEYIPTFEGAHKSTAELATTGAKLANNSDLHVVKITLTTAAGEPVRGVSSALRVETSTQAYQTAGVLTVSPIREGGKVQPGVYYATVKTTLAGTPVIVVKYVDKNNTEHVINNNLRPLFVAGPVDTAVDKSHFWVSDGVQVANGGKHTVSVKLADQYGNPVKGKASALKPSTSGLDGATIGNFTDHNDGTYTADVISSKHKVGTATVTLKVGEKSLSVKTGKNNTAIFTAGAIDAGQSIVKVQKDGKDTNQVTAGDTVTVLVTPKDQDGNLVDLPAGSTVNIPGVSAAVALTKQSNGTYTATGTTTTATGDADSQKVTFPTSQNLNGKATLKVVPGAPASAVFDNQKPESHRSGVAVTNPGTVTVKDAHNNLVAKGTKVWIKVPGADNPVEVTVGDNGKATIPNYTPKLSSDNKITVYKDKEGTADTTDSAKLGEKSITVPAGTPAGKTNGEKRTELQLTPRDATSSGSPKPGTVVDISATVKDAAGNLVGKGVKLSVKLPDGSVVPVETNERSMIVATNSQKPLQFIAGDAGVTQTVEIYDGESIDNKKPLDTASVTPEKDPAKAGKPIVNGTAYSIAQIDDEAKLANGTAYHLVTITLKDAYGDPVTGKGKFLSLKLKEGQAANSGYILGTPVKNIWYEFTPNAEIPRRARRDLSLLNNIAAGENGVYTARVFSTRQGTPIIAATYDDGETRINEITPVTNMQPLVVRDNGLPARYLAGSAAKVVFPKDPISSVVGEHKTNNPSITVTDAQGNPVAKGTEIYIAVPGADKPVKVTVGDNGVANIPDYTATDSGDSKIKVFSDAEGKTLIAEGGNYDVTPKKPVIELANNHRVSGHVDKKDVPAGSTVTVTVPKDEGQSECTLTGTTDAEGKFAIAWTEECPRPQGTAKVTAKVTDKDSGKTSAPSDAASVQTAKPSAPAVNDPEKNNPTKVSGKGDKAGDKVRVCVTPVADPKNPKCVDGIVKDDKTFEVDVPELHDGDIVNVVEEDKDNHNLSDKTTKVVEFPAPSTPTVNLKTNPDQSVTITVIPNPKDKNVVPHLTVGGKEVTLTKASGKEEYTYLVPANERGDGTVQVIGKVTDHRGKDSKPSDPKLIPQAGAPDGVDDANANGKRVVVDLPDTTPDKAIIKVKDADGKVIGTATYDKAKDKGKVTVTYTDPDNPPSDGDKLTITVTDPQTNRESAPFETTVDAKGPAKPSITVKQDPKDGSATVTITPKADDLPKITGGKVHIVDPKNPGKVVEVPGKLSDDGKTIIVSLPSDTIPDGVVITGVVTDDHDNDSEPSDPYTVDKVPPTLNVDGADGSDKAGTSNGKTVSGKTEPGATVTVTYTPKGADDPVTIKVPVGNDGSFTTPLDPPASGVITVTATDPAGNTTTQTVTVDETAPAKPAVDSTRGLAGDPLVVTAQEQGGKLTVTYTPDGSDKPKTITVDLAKPGEGVSVEKLDNGKATVTITLPEKVKNKTDIKVVHTDPAGNKSEEVATTVNRSKPTTPTVELDPKQPTVVKGKADPGATVTVCVNTKDHNDKKKCVSTVADDEGNYQVSLPKPLESDDELHIVATKDGEDSDPLDKTVDFTPPAPARDLDSDGTKITGKGEPGATVTVTVPGGDKVTGKVDEDGNFVIPLPKPLDEGDKYTVTLTDEAGNVSDPVTGIVDTKNTISDPKLSDDGTEVTGKTDPNSKVTVTKDGKVIGVGTADKDGKFSITIPKGVLKDGDTIIVNSIDPAGNQASAKLKYQVFRVLPGKDNTSAKPFVNNNPLAVTGATGWVGYLSALLVSFGVMIVCTRRQVKK